MVDPTRVVADADVLMADLLVGGTARDAMDHIRRHSWMTLIVSEQLLDDAEAGITRLSDSELARDWRTRIEAFATDVQHPRGDHPALGCVRAADAAHLLSLDPEVTGAETNRSLQRWVDVSVRSPDAFDRLFDPSSLYAATIGGEYPGPDRDPRS
jgi:hypothetical protein